jgi:hypothetical protein
MSAQMPPASKAIAATAAHDVPLSANLVAYVKVADVRAGFDDLTGKLVTDDKRNRNGLLRPGVPLVDMKIRSADSGCKDSNLDIVDAHLRLGNVFNPKAPFRLRFY